MEIRTPTPDDLDALLDFFERVPESERTFFKEHVLDRPTVEGWLTTGRGRRGLAFDEAERAVAMFGALGFVADGLLRDHVRDHDGELRDLVLLSHAVADAWSAMETAGIDDALRAPGG